MRYPSFMCLIILLGAASAFAQPLVPDCYSPDRLGWSGPATGLGCQTCCGCRSAGYSMEWQRRSEDAGWGAQPISSIVGRYTNGPLPGLTHLERYCMRVRFADDAGPGLWGPSTSGLGCTDAGSDLCFTWDSIVPSPPVLLDGGVIAGGNRFQIAFTPSTDDGGGVMGYRVRYQPSGVASQGSFGSSVTSPVSDILGEGTYDVSVFAEDRAGNVSVPSSVLTLSFGFDASVPVAAAPLWPFAVTSQAYVDIEWPDDGADSWVVTQRSRDGGWLMSVRPRVSGLGALMAVGASCRRHAIRIARVVGDQVSNWSTPSAELLFDDIDPLANGPQLISVDGGVALISWAAATDGCPSGMTYRLERSVNGVPFSLRTLTNTTQVSDVLPASGQLAWRVVAVDGAGNAGTSAVTAMLTLVLADAGPSVDAGEVDAGEVDAGEVDAGEVDAGEVDAGEVDAGEFDAGFVEPDAGIEEDAGVLAPQRRATVGCGCDGGGSVTALLLALWLSRARSGRPNRSHRPK